MTAIVEIGTIEYEPSQRERWVAGELALEWARRFRKVPGVHQLFRRDVDELAEKLAEGTLKPERRPYGFYEALAAIVLFHATGYLPMSPTHNFQFPDDSKEQIVEKLIGADVPRVIRDQTKFGATQAPDLLMYQAGPLGLVLLRGQGTERQAGPEAGAEV